MPKLSIKIAFPIILAGIFSIVALIALGYEQLNPSFLVVFFFLIVYIFSFGLATGQNVTTPIKKLLASAKELTEGNLSSRVYLESKDELSELAKAFNEIADRLETSQIQEKNTEKSVGIKVKLEPKI
jgi:nitrogen fixation/metabolism regulation signal transduction histidine kinase